ncbi:MAG: response regulator, partial [Candidatus Aminicenantes bacterium]|nr:response regulator [Candidatus Aminicenantes bacterium]
MENNNKVKPPVLLVDDEIQILISYNVMLKSAGIKNTFTLEDSRKVLPFLHENGASAIKLDLTMPFISGQELLVKIKEEFPEIPVIVATATNDITTAIECMQNGAENYLVKPIEKNHFIS